MGGRWPTGEECTGEQRVAVGSAGKGYLHCELPQEERLAVEEGLVSFGSLGLWGRSREVQLERHRGRLTKREGEIGAVFIGRSRRKDAQGCTKR